MSPHAPEYLTPTCSCMLALSNCLLPCGLLVMTGPRMRPGTACSARPSHPAQHLGRVASGWGSSAPVEAHQVHTECIQ